MSNEMSLFGGSSMPSYFKGEIDGATKALAGGGGGSNRRISIEGGVFRMIVDGKQVAESEDRKMNIVVVAVAPHINRQYYADTYVKGKVIPPACWSADGDKPSPEAENRQSPTCSTCPKNIAGSGSGNSRACRYQHRLAVVLEGEIGGPIYQLALPATSLFGRGEENNTKLPLQAYAKFLLHNGAPITGVVTEMRFDTAAATPKLTFKAVRPLSEEDYLIAKDQGASQEATQAVTLTVFKMDAKAAVPAGPATAAAMAKMSATVAAVEDDEDAPVVTSKAKPAPTAKRPVSDVIDAWDE